VNFVKTRARTTDSDTSHEAAKQHYRFIDMGGRVCGSLTVVKFSHFHRNLAHWLCKCICGKEVFVSGNSLRTGNTKSCGCSRKNINHPVVHGQYGKPIYRTWQSIIARCDRPSHKSYKDYGGRGITVCDSWRKFSNFYADMGDRPAGTTIERIDNSKGYEPGNCEWQDAQHQARNRRNGRYLTAFGETKLLVEWEEDERCKVWRDTLCWRIAKGWDIELAMSTPPTRNFKSKRGVKSECGLTKTKDRRDGCAVWTL
jgi:hypothetical protein